MASDYLARARPPAPSERASPSNEPTLRSRRAFIGTAALFFAASAGMTIAWCQSMSAMGGMPMPGGWTMPMTWMRMPGQTWPGAAASFLGMWVVMMAAMMLPSLVPMLWRYREVVGRAGVGGPGQACAGCTVSRAGKAVDHAGEARLGWLTTIVAIGYFFVWALFGMIAFPLGVALAAVEMRQPALSGAVPIAAGVVVMLAGLLQLTPWKARQLACCRAASGHGVEARAPREGHGLSPDTFTALRHGMRLGLHCCYCCAGLSAILLILGVMDLRAMAVVTAAITIERLAPAGDRVARAIGVVIVAAGLFLIARAVGIG